MFLNLDKRDNHCATEMTPEFGIYHAHAILYTLTLYIYL